MGTSQRIQITQTQKPLSVKPLKDIRSKVIHEIRASLPGPWPQEADLWPPRPPSPTAEQRPLNSTSTREIYISQFHPSFEEAIRKKKSTVGEAENNWLISDFWITGEFSFSVQTLDNLVVSPRTVGVKVSPNSKQASLHFLRYSTEQNINARGLYLKTQRLSGKKKSSLGFKLKVSPHQKLNNNKNYLKLWHQPLQ